VGSHMGFGTASDNSVRWKDKNGKSAEHNCVLSVVNGKLQIQLVDPNAVCHINGKLFTDTKPKFLKIDDIIKLDNAISFTIEKYDKNSNVPETPQDSTSLMIPMTPAKTPYKTDSREKPQNLLKKDESQAPKKPPKIDISLSEEDQEEANSKPKNAVKTEQLSPKKEKSHSPVDKNKKEKNPISKIQINNETEDEADDDNDETSPKTKNIPQVLSKKENLSTNDKNNTGSNQSNSTQNKFNKQDTLEKKAPLSLNLKDSKSSDHESESSPDKENTIVKPPPTPKFEHSFGKSNKPQEDSKLSQPEQKTSDISKPEQKILKESNSSHHSKKSHHSKDKSKRKHRSKMQKKKRYSSSYSSSSSSEENTQNSKPEEIVRESPSGEESHKYALRSRTKKKVVKLNYDDDDGELKPQIHRKIQHNLPILKKGDHTQLDYYKGKFYF